MLPDPRGRIPARSPSAHAAGRARAARSARLAIAAALLLVTPAHAAPPDINGPGHVLTVGRLWMKVTNFGILGNPFVNLSSDPSAQWPGASGVEYLNSILLAVGAKDLAPPAGAPAHRVSYSTEWSPATPEAADRIYTTFEGQVNGERFANDDGDVDPVTGEPRIDEDFLDGRDNDGDGRIDEDFDAIGAQTYTCTMRDDGYYSFGGGQTNIPLGLECHQMAWAYGRPGYQDFAAVRYQIFNRSGHVLDSVYVGFRVDADCGPATQTNYYMDDADLPGYPNGEFPRVLGSDEPQRQYPHAAVSGVSPDSALCPRVVTRVNGFSIADADGDGGQTPGIATFLLLDHTTDPRGYVAPPRVGFRAYRSFTAGTPYAQGGNPTDDSTRYAFMSSTEHIDPATGFVSAASSGISGDQVAWCSVGPFVQLQPGASIAVTIGYAVASGTYGAGLVYSADYHSYRLGTLSGQALLAQHPVLANALRIQQAHDGVYEDIPGNPTPDFHGRETALRLPPGSPPEGDEDCHDITPRTVTANADTWFDFDCDWCSGVWDATTQRGLVHHTWRVPVPPAGVPVFERSDAPRVLGLAPNPAGGVVHLELALPRAARLEADIYDVAGRLVRRVAVGRMEAGRHTLEWDGRDAAGRRVAPAVYLWRVRTPGLETAVRMVRIE